VAAVETQAPFEQVVAAAVQSACDAQAPTQRPVGEQAKFAAQPGLPSMEHSGSSAPQTPRLQTLPASHCDESAQPVLAQTPALQVLPEGQSRSALHCATQRPLAQIYVAPQSLS
jgi:hypothetical protein